MMLTSDATDDDVVVVGEVMTEKKQPFRHSTA